MPPETTKPPLVDESMLPFDSSGSTKEEGAMDHDICVFLQKEEIGLTLEEAKKTTDALGRHLEPWPH